MVRELNCKISKMMGYTVSKDKSFMSSGMTQQLIPNYSGNPRSAWEVVNFMNERGYYLTLDQNTYDDGKATWAAHFCKEYAYPRAVHENPFEAICLAALEAWYNKKDFVAKEI
jgi:hypothetical protein